MQGHERAVAVKKACAFAASVAAALRSLGLGGCCLGAAGVGRAREAQQLAREDVQRHDGEQDEQHKVGRVHLERRLTVGVAGGGL